jgi:hypothetical protein
MKRIHYVNFGLAKTGTTWLFHALTSYPGVDYPCDLTLKENRYLEQVGYPLDGYVNQYKSYDISLSFSPNLCMLDSEQFYDLDRYTTHYSIILRNPYEIANSLYNYQYSPNQAPNNNSTFVQDLFKIHYFDSAKIIKRIKSKIAKPILILYNDQIVENPTAVIEQVVTHLELEYNNEYFDNFTNEKINASRYWGNLTFSKSEIAYMNEGIDRTAEYLNKDLSHWKKIT